MALLKTRKSTLRKNGIARRQQMLQAARTLLETRELDEISLGDVAALARVPKGSAYHFYEDITDLYSALLASCEAELVKALQAPVRSRSKDWQGIVETLNQRGAAFFNGNKASMQLQVGPKIPTELKLRDRKNDATLAGIFERHIDRAFELPRIPDRAVIFFRAIEIADLMFMLSVLEHGHITPQMANEASRAMCAYLRCYIPADLPRRTRQASRS